MRFPCGTPAMYLLIGLSSEIFPRSTSCSSAVPVNVLLTLPIRIRKLVLIGRPVAISRTPNALTYGTAPRRHTPTIAPGIDSCRITPRIAAVSAAALEPDRPETAAAGPASTTTTASTQPTTPNRTRTRGVNP